MSGNIIWIKSEQQKKLDSRLPTTSRSCRNRVSWSIRSWKTTSWFQKLGRSPKQPNLSISVGQGRCEDIFFVLHVPQDSTSTCVHLQSRSRFQKKTVNGENQGVGIWWFRKWHQRDLRAPKEICGLLWVSDSLWKQWQSLSRPVAMGWAADVKRSAPN